VEKCVGKGVMWLVAPESSIQYWLDGLSEALNPTENWDISSRSGERDVPVCVRDVHVSLSNSL